MLRLQYQLSINQYYLIFRQEENGSSTGYYGSRQAAVQIGVLFSNVLFRFTTDTVVGSTLDSFAPNESIKYLQYQVRVLYSIRLHFIFRQRRTVALQEIMAVVIRMAAVKIGVVYCTRVLYFASTQDTSTVLYIQMYAPYKSLQVYLQCSYR